MAFDKKHYNTIKAFMDKQVRSRPWCAKPDLEAHIKSFLPLIVQSVHDEDYEAAKAVYDAIREFLNQFLDEPIPEDAKLKLPEFKELDIRCHISYTDPKKHF